MIPFYIMASCCTTRPYIKWVVVGRCQWMHYLTGKEKYATRLASADEYVDRIHIPLRVAANVLIVLIHTYIAFTYK
jgi:hypothetical protein